MKPVLYTEDKEEIKAGRDAKMTMKVASMSCYLGTSQKQSDEETYKNYFVDYGDQYFCVLCYNMQLSTSNIPNILCPMELRTAPVSKKNSGNISNFKTHMTTQHPLFLSQKHFKELINDTNDINNAVSKKLNKRVEAEKNTVTAHFKPISTSKRKSNDTVDPIVMEEIVKLIAHGSFPLNLVENHCFRQFVDNITGVSNKFPCRKTVTNHIKQLYDKEVVQFTDLFKKSERYALSITTDLSTAKNNFSYGAITCHYLDREMLNLRDELMVIANFPYKVHSGENIRDWVLDNVYEVCDPSKSKTYDIDNKLKHLPKLVIAITADCASNNGKFEELNNLNRIRCLGHRLNTLGNTLDTHSQKHTTEFSKFCECVLNINNILHHSKGCAHIKQALNEYQLNKGLRVMGPITGPTTRWTYGPKYLRRSLKLLPQLSAIIENGSLSMRGEQGDSNIEFKKWVEEFEKKENILQFFMALFTRLEFWITVTESSKYPTISMVLYAINDIEKLVQHLIHSVELLKTDFMNRYGNADVDEFLNKPVDILKQFQKDFTKVFVDDMKTNASSAGKNDQFFRGNEYLIIAKFLDIRFMWYDDNGTISISKPYVRYIKEITQNHFISRFGRNIICEFSHVSTSNDLVSSAVDDDDTTPPPTFEHVFSKEVSNYCKVVENLITESYVDPVDGNGKITRIYKERLVIMNMDPLKFWKDHEKQFPHLFRIAVEVLPTPAQSAPSERVFSKLTKIVNPGRKSLGADLGGKLVQLSVRYNSQVLSRKNLNQSRLVVNVGKDISFPPYGIITDNITIDYHKLEDLIDNILDEEWAPDEDGEDSADEEERFNSAEVAEVADELVDLSGIHDDDNDDDDDNLVNDDHHDTNVSSCKRSRPTTIPTRYRE